MADFMCPSLDRLGTLLQAAYARRDRFLADNKNMEAIRGAERNLRRIHNLITHHRSSCRHCRFNEATMRLPGMTIHTPMWFRLIKCTEPIRKG